jgi:type I restriction enzyme S subunit
MVDGPFGSNLKTIHYRESGIPIMQSGFVTNGRFYAKKYLYVNEEKFEEQKRSSVKGGDILMAKIGANAGACAIVPLNHPISILAGNSLKITPNHSIVDIRFLNIYLQNLKNKGYLERLCSTTAQPALSLKTLKKLKIIFPPLPEQQKIAEILSQADAKIKKEEQEKAQLEQLKKGLMQQLLTGQKRVKV